MSVQTCRCWFPRFWQSSSHQAAPCIFHIGPFSTSVFLASCCYIHLWSAAKHVDGAFSRLTESAGISRSSLQSSVSDLQAGILSMCADFLISTSSSTSWFNCASKASSLVCSKTCRNTINKQLRLFISNKLAVWRCKKGSCFQLILEILDEKDCQRWCVSSYMAFNNDCNHEIVTNPPTNFYYFPFCTTLKWKITELGW